MRLKASEYSSNCALVHGEEKPQEAAVLIVPTRELENLPRGGLGKNEMQKRATKLLKDSHGATEAPAAVEPWDGRLKWQLGDTEASSLARTRRRRTALSGRCHAPPQELKKGGAKARTWPRVDALPRVKMGVRVG